MLAGGGPPFAKARAQQTTGRGAAAPTAPTAPTPNPKAMVARTLIALAALAACGSAQTCPTQPDTPGCECVERQDVRIIAITHGPQQVDGSYDSFWSVIHEGIVTAGANLGVQVEHYSPSLQNIVQDGLTTTFNTLVDRAIAEAPDGVIISIPSNTVVDTALTKLANAGARRRPARPPRTTPPGPR